MQNKLISSNSLRRSLAKHYCPNLRGKQAEDYLVDATGNCEWCDTMEAALAMILAMEKDKHFLLTANISLRAIKTFRNLLGLDGPCQYG